MPPSSAPPPRTYPPSSFVRQSLRPHPFRIVERGNLKDATWSRRCPTKTIQLESSADGQPRRLKGSRWPCFPSPPNPHAVSSMSYSDNPKTEQLPISLSPPPKPKSSGFSARRTALVVAISLSSLLTFLSLPPSSAPLPASSSLCKQHVVLLPSIHKTITETFKTPRFKEQAIEWLSEAVQFETESYDDNGLVGEDSRWEKFGAFHECEFDSLLSDSRKPRRRTQNRKRRRAHFNPSLSLAYLRPSSSLLLLPLRPRIRLPSHP